MQDNIGPYLAILGHIRSYWSMLGYTRLYQTMYGTYWYILYNGLIREIKSLYSSMPKKINSFCLSLRWFVITIPRRLAWHSRSINITCTLWHKVRLRQRRGYCEEHGNGQVERVEHPERLQASMGRLDPAESREEGGGTLEGEALHFISIRARRRILFTGVFTAHSTSGIDIPQRGGMYYRDYRWVYLNSPDSYSVTHSPPLRPSVFCVTTEREIATAVITARNERLHPKSIDCSYNLSFILC